MSKIYLVDMVERGEQIMKASTMTLEEVCLTGLRALSRDLGPVGLCWRLMPKSPFSGFDGGNVRLHFA